MGKNELIEALAGIEHTRWGDWQRYLHSRGYRLEHETYLEARHEGGEPVYAEMLAGSLLVNASLVMGWERQIDTPYADLSEREKQSDRDQVMRYWNAMVRFVESWIERDGGFDDEAVERAARWTREMTA